MHVLHMSSTCFISTCSVWLAMCMHMFAYVLRIGLFMCVSAYCVKLASHVYSYTTLTLFRKDCVKMNAYPGVSSLHMPVAVTGLH